jgi:hypothetical protein
MLEQEEKYEYELISISFEQSYEQPEEDVVWRVSEDAPSQNNAHTEIEYDADGIPMGQSMEGIRKREAIIDDFLRKWSAANTERKVFNNVMQEYIYVRAISIAEAKEHSAKSYKSTRALMLLDEVLKNASPIKRVPKKSGDKNQKEFVYMLVMIYIGTIKLTVGVKKNANKIQYGISALKPDEPLVDYSMFKKSKKKRSP